MQSQFRVKGVARETGGEISTTVFADSKEDAINRASKRGILVSEIHPERQADAGPAEVAPPSPAVGYAPSAISKALAVAPDYSALRGVSTVFFVIACCLYVLSALTLAAAIWFGVACVHDRRLAAQQDQAFFDSILQASRQIVGGAHDQLAGEDRYQNEPAPKIDVHFNSPDRPLAADTAGEIGFAQQHGLEVAGGGGGTTSGFELRLAAIVAQGEATACGICLLGCVVAAVWFHGISAFLLAFRDMARNSFK
jgi:hypothetical protein